MLTGSVVFWLRCLKFILRRGWPKAFAYQMHGFVHLTEPVSATANKKAINGNRLIGRPGQNIPVMFEPPGDDLFVM